MEKYDMDGKFDVCGSRPGGGVDYRIGDITKDTRAHDAMSGSERDCRVCSFPTGDGVALVEAMVRCRVWEWVVVGCGVCSCRSATCRGDGG